MDVVERSVSAGDGPLFNGGRKSLLRRLFGHVEVAEESDQSGDDPAPIGAVNCINGGSCVRKHALIIHSQKKFWRSVDSGLRRSINRWRTTNEIHVADLP